MAVGGYSVSPSAYGPIAGSSTQSTLIPGAAPTYGALSSQMGNIYGGLQNQASGLVQNYGQVQQELLAQQYQQAGAQQQQQLESSGLGNSTVMNAVQRGLGQSQALAEQNLSQNVNQEQLGVLGQFGLAGAGEQSALAGQYQQQVGNEATVNQNFQNQYGILTGYSYGGAAGGGGSGGGGGYIPNNGAGGSGTRIGALPPQVPQGGGVSDSGAVGSGGTSSTLVGGGYGSGGLYGTGTGGAGLSLPGTMNPYGGESGLNPPTLESGLGSYGGSFGDFGGMGGGGS